MGEAFDEIDNYLNGQCHCGGRCEAAGIHRIESEGLAALAVRGIRPSPKGAMMAGDPRSWTWLNSPRGRHQPDSTWPVGPMLEARRYRAYLTPEQSERASQWLGAQRFLWNLALEQRNTAWQVFRQPARRFDQDKELKGLRAGVDWLKDVPQVAQQQLLADLDQAFKNWWGGSHGQPTWRKRGQGQGMRFPAKECGEPAQINRRWSTIRLPKLGPVRYRRDRHLNGAMRSVTLKQDRVGDWFVVILVDTDAQPAETRTDGPVIGVDRGVVISAQASDGRSWQCPAPGPGEAQRRLRLERKLARQQKGSRRRERTKRQLARVRRRDARRREDWAHKASAELVADAAVVGFEDLRVKNMTASAKGTTDAPGINVRQKAGLNRSILASGWGRLVEYSKYKGARVGCEVVMVPAAYTSQRCSQCGQMGRRESQASFVCPHCGHTSNADLNAAQVIATAAGQAVAGRGDPPLGESVKRQPTEVAA